MTGLKTFTLQICGRLPECASRRKIFFRTTRPKKYGRNIANTLAEIHYFVIMEMVSFRIRALWLELKWGVGRGRVTRGTLIMTDTQIFTSRTGWFPDLRA